MKKIKILVTIVTILLFGCNKILAQNKKMIEVKTPNVSTMEKFGDVPVNLFTGMPDISIPLYTLQSGEINIPITLRYHASSVKPNQPPGWVGLGWDLQCIGSISRIQKYGVDEFYIPNSINSYYNKGFYPNPANGTSGSELLSTEVNWYTPNSLINTFAPNNQTYYDKEADEFNFNFFGHSGKFYYSADKKRWVVISDEEIKVEVNGFIDNREYSHSSYGVFYKYFPFNNPLNPIAGSRYNTGSGSTLSSGANDN